MAKKSPAKMKMIAAEAKRQAAANREEKRVKNTAPVSNSDAELERYQSLDSTWRAIGLAAPACRALVDDGLYELADLRKTSLAAVKELDGMTPNAIRLLTAEMKKADLSFRK